MSLQCAFTNVNGLQCWIDKYVYVGSWCHYEKQSSDKQYDSF